MIITNGFIVCPKSKREGYFDIEIKDGKIFKLYKKGSAPSADVHLNAEGKTIVPGLVDMHVHLREPGYEWKETIESGLRAAIKGGYTSVACMPNTKPVNDCAEVTLFIKEKAKNADLGRVFPIGAISIGLLGKSLSPLTELKEAGCVAFSDDGEPVYNSMLMRRALEWAKMINTPLCLHEEDIELSQKAPMNESKLSFSMGLIGQPTIAEEVMIARDIEIARYTGGHIHICHVSTARGAELIRRAKKDGIPISAEVTAHHLFLDETSTQGFNTHAKMAPPLRERSDCEALIEALSDGIIDCVASDHAPHEPDRKECEFSEAAFGILGLQTTLPLILELVRDKRLTLMRAIEAMSTYPAKILNIPHGGIVEGEEADITIIDMEKELVFEKESNASKSINSPFFGRRLIAAPSHVFVSGREKLGALSS